METIKEIVRKNCSRLLDKSKNLSEIARQMKINPTTISRWKNGENTPEVDKIDRLAKILGVSPLEFYRTDEHLPVKTLPVSKMLKKFSSIPDQIYDLAEKLGHDHEIWDKIGGLLEDEVKDLEEARKTNKA